MLTKLVVLCVLPCAIAAAAASMGLPSRAHADATGLAIVACENLAPFLDGDPEDTTTAADEDAACRQPIPPTGPLSVVGIDAGLGNGDGELVYSELFDLDPFDQNRIDQSCTYNAVVVQATKPASGCTLLAFLFLDDEKPVTLDLPTGLASIEAGGAFDYVCTTAGSNSGQDNDCHEGADDDGDRVVVFRILNATAVNGESKTVYGRQEDVEQGQEISLSPESRFDPNAINDYDNDGVEDEVDNCLTVANPAQTNSDSAPVLTTGIGVLDHSVPNGDFAGDACDNDSDNDGRKDTTEMFADCVGSVRTDFSLFDTDGDRVHDGAECSFESNPLDPNSKPTLQGPDADGDGLDPSQESELGSSPSDADTDDDGITDGVEFKGYNTSPTTVDTDGDGCPDGTEISSFDRNTVVNSTDLFLASISFNLTNRPNIDVNKNGIVNSGDLLIVSTNFNVVPCGIPAD